MFQRELGTKMAIQQDVPFFNLYISSNLPFPPKRTEIRPYVLLRTRPHLLRCYNCGSIQPESHLPVTYSATKNANTTQVHKNGPKKSHDDDDDDDESKASEIAKFMIQDF